MNTTFAKTTMTLLIASGTLLIVIALSIIVSPQSFFGSNNIDLRNSVNLVNELKAPAGLLLAAGLFMIVAVFQRQRVDLALCLSALIYLSYAASRSVSMVIDGVPAQGLILATGLEAIIGVLCAVTWFTGRTPAGKVL